MSESLDQKEQLTIQTSQQPMDRSRSSRPRERVAAFIQVDATSDRTPLYTSSRAHSTSAVRRPRSGQAPRSGAEGPIERLIGLFDEPSRMYLEVLLERTFNPSADYMYVYILASKGKTLYTGVTNHLMHRTEEHRIKINRGFAEQYNCTKLIYFEIHYSPDDAIAREKQIKNWRREKKFRLINSLNPAWVDLSAFLVSPTYE